MKLNDVYNEWLPVKRRQVKGSTLSCYQLIYLNMLAPRFGNTDVENMGKRLLQHLSMNFLILGLSRKSTVRIF